MTFDPAQHVHTVKEISMVAACVRQWGAKYLHRLNDPKGPGANEGIDTHAVLDAMCKQGPTANVNPESKVGRWARALYPLTPPGVHTEIGQTFGLPSAPHWCAETPGGRIQRQASFKIDFIRQDFSGFGDWKTIKSMRYALDETTIHNDLQANLESFGFCTVFGRDEVDIEWLYVEKESCKVKRVPATITLANATAWLEANALPWIQLIEALRSVSPPPPVQALPHERIACDKGGRGQIFCAFLGSCQFRPAPIKVEQLLQLARK